MIDILEIKNTLCKSKHREEIEIIENWYKEKSIELIFQLSSKIDYSIKQNSFIELIEDANCLEKLIQFIYSGSVIDNEYSDDLRLELHLLSKKHYIQLADIHEKNGCVGAAFDYLIKSIEPFHKFDGVETQIVNDLPLYLKGIHLEIDGARELLLYYCSIYFRVSAELGFSLEEALSIYEISKNVAYTTDSNIYDINYWCSSAALKFKLKSNDTEHIMVILLAFLKRETNSSVKLIIIESLLRNIPMNGAIQSKLFKEAKKLKVIKEEIILQLALKLWSNMLTSPPSSKKLFSDCKELLDSINHYYSDPIQNRLIRVQKSWLINEVMNQILSRYLNYNLAYDLAYLWKTYEGHNEISELNKNQLIILSMPTMQPKKCWYLIKSCNRVRVVKFDTSVRYTDFIEEKNKIESKWLAMLEEKETHEPQKLGNPNVQRKTSEKYEENLEAIYNLNKLNKVIREYNEIEELKIFELSTVNSPLLSMLNREFEGELNISFLNTSKLDSSKKIENILFWIDPNSNLFTSEAELNAFKYFAEFNDIEANNIVIKYQDECTKDEFIKLYCDSSFDLIWISGHGIADSNNPYYSLLEISSSENLYVGELSKLPIKNKHRRLLVLNMCETASSYIRYNSMDFLSMSSVLTHSNQSVIAHHWPTSYLSSSAFGAILFMYLSEGLNWANAHSKTQILLSGGRERIISEIDISYPDNRLDILGKVDRQESNELDLFVNWGSTSYFE